MPDNFPAAGVSLIIWESYIQVAKYTLYDVMTMYIYDALLVDLFLNSYLFVHLFLFDFVLPFERRTGIYGHFCNNCLPIHTHISLVRKMFNRCS